MRGTSPGGGDIEAAAEMQYKAAATFVSVAGKQGSMQGCGFVGQVEAAHPSQKGAQKVKKVLNILSKSLKDVDSSSNLAHALTKVKGDECSSLQPNRGVLQHPQFPN